MLAHLELKITALVLAVALWFYTAGQARVEVRQPVLVDPVAAKLSQGMSISSVTPREFTLVLSVLEERGGPLPGILEPRLDLRGYRNEGKVLIPLTPALLGLSPSTRILGSDPPGLTAIDVTLEQWEYAALPVLQPRLTGVPAGMEAELVLLTPMIQARGPRRILNDVSRSGLATLPIDLRIPSQEMHRDMYVVIPSPPPGIEPGGTILARVTLRPISVSSSVAVKLVDLPLHGVIHPDWQQQWLVEVPTVVTVAWDNSLDVSPEECLAIVGLTGPVANSSSASMSRLVPVTIFGPGKRPLSLTATVAVSILPRLPSGK